MFEKRALPANARARFWGMWQCLCPPARLFYCPFQHQQLTQTFYFTPLKTYHPRLLRTYKKVIPSCFFFGYTQTPSLQLLLLLLFPSNFEFGKQHFKNFFDFPRFSTTKPHKRGQVPHELWCSRSLVRKKCTHIIAQWSGTPLAPGKF